MAIAVYSILVDLTDSTHKPSPHLPCLLLCDAVQWVNISNRSFFWSVLVLVNRLTRDISACRLILPLPYYNEQISERYL
jgi:hypothetical protein